MFKVFEDESDLLHNALIEIGASRKTKKFVENNLHLYTHFMEDEFDQNELVAASEKNHGFLPIFAAVESYIDGQVKRLNFPMNEQSDMRHSLGVN
jgi:hypothetical protein